jgi:tetratricopeptide (TPR) repeat protein
MVRVNLKRAPDATQRGLSLTGMTMSLVLFRTLVCFSLLALASVARPVSADDKRDAEAKALFQAGREAFEGGRYEAALARWQEAYDLSSRSTLLYNIGLAQDRLRQDDKALASFKAYLEQVPDSENRQEVEGRIKALEKARDERSAAAAATPTPQETANQSQVADATRNGPVVTDSGPSDTASTKPLTKQWWFWTGVGAVIVGGVVVALAASSGGGQKEAGPVASRSGITIMTLTRAR